MARLNILEKLLGLYRCKGFAQIFSSFQTKNRNVKELTEKQGIVLDTGGG